MKPLITLLIMACGIFSRLIPHLPNFSPEIVFALYLGTKNSKIMTLLTILVMATLSDVLLSWQHAWAAFGKWTFFTYSALLIIGMVGRVIKKYGYGNPFFMMGGVSTLFYWLWTNFGTWLISDLYPHTLSGFLECYIFGLPFLGMSVTASILWCAIIVVSERYLTQSLTQSIS